MNLVLQDSTHLIRDTSGAAPVAQELMKKTEQLAPSVPMDTLLQWDHQVKTIAASASEELIPNLEIQDIVKIVQQGLLKSIETLVFLVLPEWSLTKGQVNALPVQQDGLLLTTVPSACHAQ